MTDSAAANLLAAESSPYLRQHAENPVHWRAWNDAALAEAKAAGKPILLSIGYSACHWCHVMAHECFENPDIAAAMNDLFVNIKVDREERPDIDAIYQHALALMGVQGGWPLTMFCTPEAKPFWGGTYFPPTGFGGRPGFGDIVRKVAEIHATQPDQVAHNVGVIMEGLERISGARAGPRLDANDLSALLTQLTTEFDPVYGGLAGAPKFPMVPALKLAWQAGDRADDRGRLDAALRLTANRLAQGGIYDHLGGGFARYSVDDRWLVPHFEKMLYDNAQLIELFAHLWRQTNDALLADRVAETIDWAVREMRHPAGGFYAALDADSEGVEGKYYVWQCDEIDAVLGDTGPAFRAAYDVTPAGNFDGANILNRLATTPSDRDTAPELADARAKLFSARSARVPPGRDDKILTDWNGLMISGLVEASTAFARDDWLALATAAYDFVTDKLTDEDRLLHSWQDERARFDGLLEDYANMIHAATMLYEVTGTGAYLDAALAWTAYVEAHFSAEGGGFHQSSDLAADVISRTRTCHDQPHPSGNGRMAENFARLYFMTGEPRFRDAAQAVITFFAHEARGQPDGHGTLLAAADLLERGVQIVIATPRDAAGQRGGERVDEPLRETVFAAPVRRRVVLPLSFDGRPLSERHPAYGKGPVDGQAAVYICRGQTCSRPITDDATLRNELRDELRADV